jgi:hypothetical protein
MEWKCLISSSMIYEGVKSVPPPNHHCLGAPGASAENGASSYMISEVVESSRNKTVQFISAVSTISTFRCLCFEIPVLEMHCWGKWVHWMNNLKGRTRTLSKQKQFLITNRVNN